MLEQLKAIDTAAVKKLVAVTKDEKQLEEYRKGAKKRKADVDPAVYQRVIDDYDERARALKDQAVPLQNEARNEYRKLQAICDELTAACEKARVDKEELEFRHAVGELTKAALGKRLKEPQETLEKCEQDLEEAGKMRGKFVAAFHSEKDLEAGLEGIELDTATPAKTVLTPMLDVGREDAEGVPDPGTATVIMTPAMAFEAAELAETAEDGEDVEPEPGATVVLPPGKQAEETFIMSRTARLVMLADDEELTEYRLGFQNHVGRDEENDIHIASTKVSRKHALLAATPTGYTIKDLKSQSGTFVNQERITECRLSDGDRVQVGDVELVFHSV